MDGLEWKIRSRHFNGWCRGTAFQETSIYSVDFCGMFWIKRGLQWTPTRWQWSWRTWSTVDGCEILHQLVTMKGNYMNHYKWWDFNGITGITDLPTGDSDFANHPGFFGAIFWDKPTTGPWRIMRIQQRRGFIPRVQSAEIERWSVNDI